MSNDESLKTFIKDLQDLKHLIGISDETIETAKAIVKKYPIIPPVKNKNFILNFTVNEHRLFGCFDEIPTIDEIIKTFRDNLIEVYISISQYNDIKSGRLTVIVGRKKYATDMTEHQIWLERFNSNTR